MERWNRVGRCKTAPRGHHIGAVHTVTLDVEAAVTAAVLYHKQAARPAMHERVHGHRVTDLNKDKINIIVH